MDLKRRRSDKKQLCLTSLDLSQQDNSERPCWKQHRPVDTTAMVPPVSYYNTPWGRRNSDFDEASSKRASRSASPSRSNKAFTHAPARRDESPPQSRSPSPHRGSIHELAASRVLGAYGQVVKAAMDAGFKPPSREGIREYADRALPATPTSVVSVEEVTKAPRKESVTTSMLSAREVTDDQGGVCTVVLRHKRKFLPLAPLQTVPLGLTTGPDSPTLGSDAPVIVAEGRMCIFEETPSPSSLYGTRSTFDSSIDTVVELNVPRSPTWKIRMQKRAYWALKWLDQYRGD